jgi:hypothetical protein
VLNIELGVEHKVFLAKRGVFNALDEGAVFIREAFVDGGCVAFGDEVTGAEMVAVVVEEGEGRGLGGLVRGELAVRDAVAATLAIVSHQLLHAAPQLSKHPPQCYEYCASIINSNRPHYHSTKMTDLI